MQDPGDKYQALLAETPDNLELHQAMEWLGELIDLASDLGELEGLQVALGYEARMRARLRSTPWLASLDYNIGNAHSAIRKIRHKGSDGSWQWQIAEAEAEIYCFRSALQLAGKDETVRGLRCRALTNLGNALDFLGRFVESIECYDHALALDPSFAMARGNRGFALQWYGRSLYRPSSRPLFFKTAFDEMQEALKGELEGDAREGFQGQIAELRRVCDHSFLETPLAHEEVSIGTTKEEQAYRKWCLSRRLFLEPENDVWSHSTAAQDSLLLPPIQVPLGDGPFFQGMFNQLKQEYVTARYLCYQGLNSKDVHFSDRGAVMLNTLVYPSYGLSLEKVKVAFRMAYSLLDKIAFFLNIYLGLGIEPKRLYFSGLWYQARKELLEAFRQRQNWPLRGLFWLGKDLFESDSLPYKALDPSAKEINLIRRFLEHRFLIVHEMGAEAKEKDGTGLRLMDPEAHHINRRDFEDRTCRLLKMVRAALLYLSLGVWWEERSKKVADGAKKKIPPFILDVYEDDWKR